MHSNISIPCIPTHYELARKCHDVRVLCPSLNMALLQFNIHSREGSSLYKFNKLIHIGYKNVNDN